MKRAKGEYLSRRREGNYGLAGKGRGSSAYQFSADLMPALTFSLKSSKHQLGKTTFLQLAFSSAVTGRVVFVLLPSFYFTNYNTVRVKRRKNI